MTTNDRNNVSEAVKDTAGAAFHSAHDALEATENAAMNAVDTTANAVRNITNDDKEKRDYLD